MKKTPLQLAKLLRTEPLFCMDSMIWFENGKVMERHVGIYDEDTFYCSNKLSFAEIRNCLKNGWYI